MKIRIHAPLLALGLLPLLGSSARSAELVALSPQTWERYAPQGKEVDAIHGDFARSNGVISAVIAQPRRGRNANMTVREVGGCLIDLTVEKTSNDQLSAFYPGAGLRELRFAGVDVESPRTYEAAELDRLFVQARRVTLRLVAAPREKEPDVEVAYSLEDGSSSLLVTSTSTNRGDAPIDVELVDEIKPLDVLHAAERGNLVMTTGPFLEVTLKAEGPSGPSTPAAPGDSLAAPGGKALLHIRVQCPNWFDVDRVQVFLNGRLDERLNFTRKTTPDHFAGSTMKFDQEIPLALSGDTHVIVVAIGEHSKLGPVMGPDHAADLPVAVSNPVFVDVDGHGFKANGDPLGELPVKGAND